MTDPAAPHRGRGADATVRVAAVDLGASSGRVLAVEVGQHAIAVEEIHRFDNHAVQIAGRLHWDVIRLFDELVTGLRLAASGGPIDAVGIDSWAVDFGLLDADGDLLGNPVSYRDDRTIGMPERVWERVSPAQLYAVTGVQHQRFNTVFQVEAARQGASFPSARTLALIPDLLSSWLCGRVVAEVTNASTTQLFDVARRTWSVELAQRLDLDPGLLPEVVEPGTVIGQVRDGVVLATGLAPGTPVIAVGSHDTASAVVAVPAVTEDFAYISCGTWSLVGLELPAPVLTEESRLANFTNELGVDGTVRYLKNVMGLWLLQECMRDWSLTGADLAGLLAAAAAEPAASTLIDADDPRFLAPGNMPRRIADALVEAGGQVPDSRPALVRCILDSLAQSYALAIDQASRLAGRSVRAVHIVGGGSRNELLCRLTAERTGLPVIAGPVEATGIGNALVQARTLGVLDGPLAQLRALTAATQPLRRYEPAPSKAVPGRD